ncbi:hypothetical protein KEM52_004894, partial [Ascosphaera acerosa]
MHAHAHAHHSLQHTVSAASVSSGRHPHNSALPPPPPPPPLPDKIPHDDIDDDGSDDDDDGITYDDVLQEVEDQMWMPTARSSVSQPVPDPEAFIFRTPSAYINARGQSISSIASADLPGRAGSGARRLPAINPELAAPASASSETASPVSPAFDGGGGTRGTADGSLRRSMHRLSLDPEAPFMIGG